ncbi:branched-chain amino acid ABC transporter permease [Variovorax sp. YR216]|uniref:branched-chain amino acid ABC transporter permease n=1 Tax=Variovorax sp. YR216 TaxID=1882828 RepID=UPI00089D8C77|nr:branched-chain amino acid ABC transporter permease [Variovorax sp. YR216]SEB05611.1 branched-chain amino acid transport system permease protein [Variovorax sp. YR216]
MDKNPTLVATAPVSPVMAAALRRIGAGPLRLGFGLALLVALAVVPLVSLLAGQSYYVTLVSRMMVFALAALGLNLVVGYGGMVSFGHALYVGVGAFAVGILSFHGIGNGWVHLAVALGAGAVLATLIGLVCLRVNGIAFIMITLAFAQMMYFAAVGLKQYGGDDGYALPARSDFGVLNLENDVALYYVIFALLAVTLLAFHRLVNARFGMLLRGCRTNERRMRALGYDTVRARLVAYVISALVCVLAGMLLANLARFVSPSYMQWSVSGELIVMAVLGGTGSLLGPVLGAIVWLALEELLSSGAWGLPGDLEALLKTHWLGVLGIVVVLVTLTLKQGLYGWLQQREQREEKTQ